MENDEKPPATLPDPVVLPTLIGQETRREAPALGSGRIYYVAGEDSRADDNNNGLYPEYRGGEDGPWRTVQHAAESMKTGDTAYLRAGTYHEADIHFSAVGNPGDPITLAAYQDEQVILDGSHARGKTPGIFISEGQGHYVIRGLTIMEMPGHGITTDSGAGTPYRDINILDCVIQGNGRSGINLAGVYGFLVANVEAQGNGYYGLEIKATEDGSISSADGEVRLSNFHHHTGKEGHGMAINQGHDIVVRDSRAYYNTIHGFDASDWPKGGELSNNLVFEGNVSYDNGVAGFSINSDSHHVVFRSNIAWGNGADWASEDSAPGFFCYEGCWYVEFYDNVAAKNSAAGFEVTDQFAAYSHPQDSLLIFKNNIAWDNGRPQWDHRPALLVEGEEWQVVAEHNNWFTPGNPENYVVVVNLVGERGEFYNLHQLNNGEFQVANRSIEPGFLDPSIGDYRLTADSPMVDAGVDIGLPYCGSAPDLGAFEICP